ncbi:hypothetical protein BFJ70_g15823 [Fusarium oxysporum]|nr:hypothetical protein BFJ70_g15823 [Fusarium oxysporum]
MPPFARDENLTQWDYDDLDFRTPQLSGINSRGERDLTKRFDEFNIDWQMAEEQLCKWSPLFRAGKKLRIDISFVCKEEPHGSRVVQQQGSRGSATARQLAQRDQLLETQEAAGQPRVWKDVYDLMRCNGNLCQG